MDRTYIIDEDNHNLSVFSIITDDDNLWDFIKNNYDNQDYIVEQIDSFRVLGLRNK